MRWKPSAISPQPSITPRIVAPRARACARLSSTSAPAPSAITKPSRSLLNGRAAASGGSLRVDSADSSEKRIRLSGFTDASVPINQRRLGTRRGGSPRRQVGSRWRPRRRQLMSPPASPWCRSAPPGSPPPSRTGSARSSALNLPVAGGTQQIVVGHRLVGAGGRGEGEPLRPFQFHRAAGPGTSGRGSRPASRCPLRRSPPRSRTPARRSDSAGADSSSTGYEIHRAGDVGAQSPRRESG